MKLRCLFFKKRLVIYADGELSHRASGQIEDHLVDCPDCRARLLRLRAGQRFAGQVPRRRAPAGQWEAIEELIVAEARRQQEPDGSRAVSSRVTSSRLGWSRAGSSRIASWWRPGRVSMAGVVLAFVSLSLLILTVVISRHPRSNTTGSAVAMGSVDLTDFHSVSISDIGSSTEPHVVAEGYVSDVRIDSEDGDLVFKLVDDVKRPGPFIVCEIISPIKVAAPPVGSHVRVYGVSRYDSKADHQWYEVHPVLDIEVVRR